VPINTLDFSSALLQAQSSKAKVVGLANAGADTTNSIKQAAEFGIVRGGQKMAGVRGFLDGAKTPTPWAAQGLPLSHTLFTGRACCSPTPFTGTAMRSRVPGHSAIPSE